MTTRIGLPAGTWLPGARGVLHWTPAPPSVPRLLIACPTCSADVGAACRTGRGKTTAPHGARREVAA